jgi:hypothetical protein
MEFGEASGLAVSADYDKRIADQRYYDQQFKRARAENMAELKAFEDDLDYMNASNSFDHELIKGEANKTIREIGEVIRNNQDWRYNPDVRRIINEKKKYLKSNQNVIRGMASDSEYKEYLKDMKEVSKNPAFHDFEQRAGPPAAPSVARGGLRAHPAAGGGQRLHRCRCGGPAGAWPRADGPP